MKAAFEGVCVLDFTQGVAGPHASMLLAQHGAQVIKIEPLTGDWGRTLGKQVSDHTAHSVAFNRGKRSIALDLKSPDGAAIVRRIAAKADVVMESFRPGVISRLGFGYETIQSENPNLVYCSVSGFGQKGRYSDRPTVDGMIQAFSGMMVMNSLPDGTPWRQAMVAVDVMSGLYTFQAIAAALLRRFRFNEGAYIDSSLMAAAAAFQGAKLMEWALFEGPAPPLYTPVGNFKTRDGHIMLSAMRPHHFKLLFELIGRADIANHSELQTADDRVRNSDRINAALNETMPLMTTEEWITLLRPEGVLCEKVNNYQEYLDNPHVAESGAVDWLEQDGFGRVPIANIPGIPNAQQNITKQHAPHIGEHGLDILGEYGFTAVEIGEMIRRGSVLSPQVAR